MIDGYSSAVKRSVWLEDIPASVTDAETGTMSSGKAMKVLSLVVLLTSLSATLATGQSYVSATDPTCGGQAPCFTDIQSAVDAAPSGGRILVAAGIYTGVSAVEVDSNTYHQVVMITESLALEGGYLTSDWTTPDPELNETAIDPEGSGRAISIVGDGSQVVTVSGLRLSGGDYSGLGNNPGESTVCPRTGSDCAGAMLAREAQVHIRDCRFQNNVSSTSSNSSDGGALLLWFVASGTSITDSSFRHNMATTTNSGGGAIQIDFGGDVTVARCIFEQNEGYDLGGAIGIFQPSGLIEITDSEFDNNLSTNNFGGAIGAKVTSDGAALSLARLIMTNNEAADFGAAIAVVKQGPNAPIVDISNVILQGNRVDIPDATSSVVDLSAGALVGLTVNIKQVTLAEHPGLSAVRASTLDPGAVTVNAVNLLIDGATNAYVGRQLSGPVTINHTNTLTNTVDALEVTEAGSPTFVGIDPITGDPRLDLRGFLTAGSAAIDAGVDSGVPDDVEGELRPVGAGFDIGADEYAIIFNDDFESGDVSAWSSSAP